MAATQITYDPNRILDDTFQLMIHSLFHNNIHIFINHLPKLEKVDATMTFLLQNGQEHTLLTLFCANPQLRHLYPKDIMIGLLASGCKWDQEVQGGKTAMSFLVDSDCNRNLIEWCVNNGANPKKGHLLVYASRGITKSQYEERVEIEKHNRYLTMNGMTPLADPDDYYPPFENDSVFSYLVSIGAPVDDVDPTTRMTPLIAACSEDNLDKVRLLVKHGASLYRKNNDGMDAWSWAELHAWKYKDKEKDLYNILRIVEAEQKKYWTKVLEQVVEQSMLQEVPFCDLLQVLSK